MKRCRTLSRFLMAAAAAGVLAFPGGAQSETFVEQNFYTRVVLSLSVKAAELQKFLSGPWEVAAMPAGPFKGANFSIVFYDRQLTQDASGKTDAPLSASWYLPPTRSRRTPAKRPSS